MTAIEIRSLTGEVDVRPLVKTEPLSIGSHPSNDVCVDEEGVAAVHCRISWNKSAYEVAAALPQGIDLNGSIVRHKLLKPGDLLRVGSVDISIVDTERSSEEREQAPQAVDVQGTSATGSEKGARGEILDPPLKPAKSEEIPIWYQRAPVVDYGQDQPPEKKPQQPDKETGPKTRGPSHRREESPVMRKEIAKEAGRKPSTLPRPPEEDWEVVEIEYDDAAEMPPSRQASRPAESSASKLDELKQRLRSAPVRPGERSITRSPLTITMFAAGLVLLLSAATFWFMLHRGALERQFDAAVADMEAGRYTQAIEKFEKFVAEHPRHSYSAEARLRIGRARIEREIVGSTPAWGRGLEALNEFIQQFRDLPAFADQQPVVSDYAERIALGAALRAQRMKEREPLAWSGEATSLLIQFSPPDRPSLEAQERIRTAVSSAEAAVRKQEALDAALEQIAPAIESGETVLALDVRRDLLDRYADLAAETAVAGALGRTLAKERSLVTYEELDRKAQTDERPHPLPPALSLAAHIRVRSDEPSAGRTVFAVAKDSCYGVDTVTGHPLWRRVIGLDSPFFPMPVSTATAAVLMFDSRHNELLLLEERTGKLIWRQMIGERVSGAPLVHQGQLYLPTLERSLYKVDLQTGTATAKLSFRHAVLAPPLLLEDDRHVVIAGERAILYTVSLRPLECVAVSYFGQGPGSVVAPLLRMGRLLLLAENDRLDSCRLRVIDATEPAGTLKQVDEARVEGHVYDAPVIRGRQLCVPTSGERINAFAVSDDPGQKPLSPVAGYRVTSPYDGPLFLSVGPDGQLWMAGSLLRKFQVTADNILLDSRQITTGISAQPLQGTGSDLFFGRRLPYTAATVFHRADRQEMVGQWRTALGAGVIECLPLEEGAALCITETGNAYRVDPKSLGTSSAASAGFDDTADLDLPLPDSLNSPLRRSRLGDGRLVVHCGAPQPQLWVIGRRGQVERQTDLEAALEADPVLLAAGLVLPMSGRLKVLPLTDSTNSAAAPVAGVADFLAPVGEGRKGRWTSLAALDDAQFVVADSNSRLRRVQVRSEPVPHLAEVSSVELDQPLDVQFVVGEDRLMLADAGRRLMLLNTSDFRLTADARLDSAASNDLWLVGERLFVETGRNRLECYGMGNELKRQWSAPLEGESLAGAPLAVDANFVVAQNGGKVLLLDGNDGRVLRQVDVGQPLSLGPRQIGPHLVVGSIDGSLYRVDSLLEAGK